MAGPGFFETFRPQDIPAMAMRKFDLDMKQKQLNMMVEEHEFKLGEIKKQKLIEENLKRLYAEATTPKEEAFKPTVEGLTLGLDKVPEGVIPSLLTEPQEIGSTTPSGPPLGMPSDWAETKMVKPKLMAEDYLNIASQAGINPMEILKQRVELAKVKPSQFAATAGRIYNPITGEVVSEKPTVPKPEKTVEKTVDYGDKIRTYFVDGTWSEELKGKTPGTETTKPTSYEDIRNASIEELKVEGIADPTLSQITKRVEEKQRKSKLLTPEEEKQQIRITGAKAAETEAVRSSSGFKTWTPEQKEQSYWTKIITKQEPRFGWGDRASMGLFGKEFNQFQLDKGLTPAMVARMQTDYKSLDKSTSNQRKIYDMMNGFVLNINKQIGEVERRYQDLPRTDTKLFNMPIVAVRKYITGSGEEASIKSYLIEISNEIGKLSTGSAASIRELSVDAQKQWKDIHDEKLSYAELMKVMNTTRDQANLRIISSKEAMDITRNAIEEIAGPTSQAPGSTQTPTTQIEPRKPGESITNYLKRTQK